MVNCGTQAALCKAALCDHLGSAADVLLRGLEKELDTSVKPRSRALQDAGYREQPRHVSIMATGVHDAGIGAAKRNVSRLLERERVHVCAEGNTGPRVVSSNHRDDTCSCDAGPDLGQAIAAKQLGDAGRGRVLLKCELGVGVKVAAI